MEGAVGKSRATIATNSLRFLSNVDSFLNNYKDANVLRSYYMQKFQKLELQQKSNLPAKLTKPTVKCPKCYITRALDYTEYQIRKRPPQSRFNRKLLRKINNLKNLTPLQRVNADKLKKYMQNKLIIRCLVCKTKIEEVLNKLPAFGGNQERIPFKKDELVQTKKKPVPLVANKKGKGKIKKDKKDMNHRITKHKAKTAKKFSAMLSSKPAREKSGSLKDFLKCL